MRMFGCWVMGQGGSRAACGPETRRWRLSNEKRQYTGTRTSSGDACVQVYVCGGFIHRCNAADSTHKDDRTHPFPGRTYSY